MSQQPLLITDTTNNRLATNNNKVDTSHNNGGTPLLPENVPLCVKQHCDLNLALYQVHIENNNEVIIYFSGKYKISGKYSYLRGYYFISGI